MKRKVKYSKYCVITTAAIFTTLFGLALYTFIEGPIAAALLIVGVILCLNIPGAYIAPLSVSATSTYIEIGMFARRKRIPLKEIASIQSCKPTMGAIRLCGSGGYFGYWGWFREGDIGKYFAYYGRASDCFLLTLTDGRKYMLGCTDTHTMVEYIAQLIKQRSE